MPPAAKKTSTRAKRTKKALGDHIRLTVDRLVVVMPADGERRSKGGLLIPATAGHTLKRCVWADVMLVGPDVRHVKAGDRVLFLPQVGLEMEIDGDEFLLLRERDVQAVAEQGDAKDGHSPGQYL
jgi:chaperonin GroES